MMVSVGLFWSVLLMNFLAAPAGLFMPWYCTRQRQWLIVPTVNIFSATFLSILVSSAVVIVERSLIAEVPIELMITDEFVRTLIAVCGISMATSLIFFLVHYTVVQEAPDIRRLARRIRRLSWWAPKAKIVLCDELLSVVSGECAICLDDLASLPASAAHAPVARGSRSIAAIGLLRLPCQHTFHGSCADRWMAREVSCPMCRKPIGNLGRCQRICLPPLASGVDMDSLVADERLAAATAGDSVLSVLPEASEDPVGAPSAVAAQDCKDDESCGSSIVIERGSMDDRPIATTCGHEQTVAPTDADIAVGGAGGFSSSDT